MLPLSEKGETNDTVFKDFGVGLMSHYLDVACCFTLSFSCQMQHALRNLWWGCSVFSPVNNPATGRSWLMAVC